MAKRQIKRCKDGEGLEVDGPGKFVVKKVKGHGWSPLVTFIPKKTVQTGKPKA